MDSSFGTGNGNNEFQQINVGSLIDTIYLYSDQCTELLKQALEREKQQQQNNHSTVIHPTNKSSSSEKTNRNIDNDNNNNDSFSSDDDEQQQQQQTEEEEEEEFSSSSSSESEGESGGEGELIEEEEQEEEENESSSKSSQVAAATSSSTSLMDTQKKAANKRRGNKKKKIITQTQQQRQIQNSIKKHVDNLICNSLPINDNEVLQISKSLLSTKHDVDLADRNYIPPLISEEYLKLCQSLQQSKSNNNVMIILLRSGRFAAGIFDSSNKGKCIVHRVCTHYTVRKGQGKAQSAQDNSRRPKSMGAQLRRAGEESLQNDIKETLCENWKQHLDNTCLIVLSCPKSMRKYFFDATQSTTTSITKHDPRIRRLPLDLGKPTYDNVCIAYQTMMTVQIKQYTMMANANINNESTTTTKTTMASSSSSPAEKKKNEEQQPNSNNNNNEIKIFPLTPLHIACQKGDIDTISTMLSTTTNEEQAYYTCQDEKGQEISMTTHDMISHKVGPYFMTCLHYAAGAGAGAGATASASGTGTVNDDNNNEDNNKDNGNDNDNDSGNDVVVDPDIAAECVTQLLLVGKADPTIVDSRDRPPIFLASHDKIKNAFRICRSKLGEEYCIDWSTKGKIGPPLTQDDIQAKKDREAEKRRAKKARQKQKKQQLKADAALEEQKKQQLEAQRIAEETAKRIRDGLQPKYVESGANACDFCQKVVKGRKRKDMFTRLDYKYCSSDCVQKHKRELMASAALARFGG